MSLHFAMLRHATGLARDEPEIPKRLDKLLGLYKHSRPALGLAATTPGAPELPPAEAKPRPTVSLQSTSRRLQEADATDALMLSHDTAFMRATSLEEKAELIRKLGRAGWCMGPIVGSERGLAVRNILAACKSKDELERVFHLLGGRSRLLAFVKDERARGAIVNLEANLDAL